MARAGGGPEGVIQGDRVSGWGDDKVLEMDDGDGGPTTLVSSVLQSGAHGTVGHSGEEPASQVLSSGLRLCLQGREVQKGTQSGRAASEGPPQVPATTVAGSQVPGPASARQGLHH